MDIQEKEWGSFVEYLKTKGIVKIGRNALGVITNLVREGSCTLGYNDLELMWETWRDAKVQAVPKWISTSERMPEEGEEVFVHSYGQVRQATRDSSWAGGFKERNCYGWQATYSQSHWIPKSIELPESFHFYYEHDAKVAKEKAMIEAQEPAND